MLSDKEKKIRGTLVFVLLSYLLSADKLIKKKTVCFFIFS